MHTFDHYLITKNFQTQRLNIYLSWAQIALDEILEPSKQTHIFHHLQNQLVLGLIELTNLIKIE